MTVDATSIASSFYAAIEDAWNRGDGTAFGAAFADDCEFIDIRGVRHSGGPELIGPEHQGIFDTIYKGSVMRYDLERARSMGDTVILANGRGTLDCPAGPLAGVHHALSTTVLVQKGDSWKAVAFHNTMEMGGS